MIANFDRARLALLVLLAVLLGVGMWAYRGVGDSLREMRATGMQTLLNTQVGTLEQWISERLREAEQQAAEPGLSAGIVRLAGGGDRARIIEDILRKSEAMGVTAALVIDPKGKVLAASDAERIDRYVTADFFAHLSPTLAGRPAFVRPYRGAGAAAGGGKMGRSWVATPIRAANGRIVAILALGSKVDEGFSDLFKVARPGLTGESLVFDAEGWLLSESRHGEELQRRGLPPRLAQPDPETDALTRLSAQAVTKRAGGGEGVLLQPYPNYLGRDVIGAWRWLQDRDIGVAIEMEASEAYAPLTYLQIGFSIVLLMMAAVWLSGFLSPGALAALLRRNARARQLGPYRLLRQIGEGAISNVYMAQHRMLKRPAAVKVLKQQATSDEWTARFQREVQLTSLLRHPNTITIYDYGTGPNGEFYYAMEYLEGLSLADLVERYGPVPPARTAYILRQACASLWEAHSCDLVHRDIKPQNIMLCEVRGERDVVKVLDFGLVKQVSGERTRDLTGAMRILGTPLYMSPERIRNPSDADARADIYALGAVGFYLLTGKRLFETETEHDLTYQVLHTAPRLTSECSPFEVPAELDALIGRCLEKDPAARPQSIAQVASALDGLLVHMPWTRSQIDAWWNKYWVGEDHPERRFTAANP